MYTYFPRNHSHCQRPEFHTTADHSWLSSFVVTHWDPVPLDSFTSMLTCLTFPAALDSMPTCLTHWDPLPVVFDSPLPVALNSFTSMLTCLTIETLYQLHSLDSMLTCLTHWDPLPAALDSMLTLRHFTSCIRQLRLFTSCTWHITCHWDPLPTALEYAHMLVWSRPFAIYQGQLSIKTLYQGMVVY